MYQAINRDTLGFHTDWDLASVVKHGNGKYAIKRPFEVNFQLPKQQEIWPWLMAMG